MKAQGRKTGFQLNIIALLALALLAFVAARADGQVEVDIPDANLEAAIRQALGIPTRPLTNVDLASLTELFACDRGIANLTGLDYCVNLTGLDLGHNNITDISPLSGLGALWSLGLGENNISDISPLAGLTNLVDLGLVLNNISNISPLSGLTNLEWLMLGHNNISDISPLSGLTQLVFALQLESNNISNISPLSGLTNLEWLELGFNNISDISPLSGLTNLYNLGLYENNISDISPLSGLTNLTHLELGKNNISDISLVSGFTNLMYLYLGENNISDISPLGGLTNLVHLGLVLNNISDISPLSGLTNLAWLRLDYNNISDISPLAGLTNLMYLFLDENNISDISPLAGLTNLTYLELDENNISDISPLSGLTNLTYLDLEDNPLDCDAYLTVIPLIIENNPGIDITYDPMPPACLNQPPIADAGPHQTVQQEGYKGTEVTLDGSGSTDPDSTPETNDDIVAFDWYEGATFLGSGETLDYTFGVGEHIVTLVVTDSKGATDEDEVIITVTGSEPSTSELRIFPTVIHRDMGNWQIMATLRLPEGLTKDQIDMGQPLLLYPGEIQATRQYAVQSGGRWKPRTTISCFFNKDGLMDAIPTDGPVELLVVGHLKAGPWFRGTGTVTIVSWHPWIPWCEFLLDYDD